MTRSTWLSMTIIIVCHYWVIFCVLTVKSNFDISLFDNKVLCIYHDISTRILNVLIHNKKVGKYNNLSFCLRWCQFIIVKIYFLLYYSRLYNKSFDKNIFSMNLLPRLWDNLTNIMVYFIQWLLPFWCVMNLRMNFLK